MEYEEYGEPDLDDDIILLDTPVLSADQLVETVETVDALETVATEELDETGPIVTEHDETAQVVLLDELRVDDSDLDFD